MKLLLIGLVFIFVACASQTKATKKVSHVEDEKSEKEKKQSKRVPTSYSAGDERR